MSISIRWDQLSSNDPSRLSDEWAGELGSLSGLEVYPRSVSFSHDALFFMGRSPSGKQLGVLSPDGLAGLSCVRQGKIPNHDNLTLQVCPLDHHNAVAIRKWLSFTAPGVLNPGASIGLGDRLGLATPGHARAVSGHGMAPVFAQQSIREMERTGRTPEQVIDDATWGVLQSGWREGYGADADHLKAPEDIDRCVAAGFTFFTIDPSDHVDDAASSDDPGVLETKLSDMDFKPLDADTGKLKDFYLGRTFDFENFSVALDPVSLNRAAVKYGGAVAHTAKMARHLASRMSDRRFELEVSVDETDSPTTVEEHVFIASELARLGVEWGSLAPRFAGRFEKGVDFIGDLEEFERTYSRHAAIARRLGPYKLSLHSGSDKFSVYPLMARHSGSMVHVKTAGTSYLEALRVIAGKEPDLFREILRLACERYPEDKASYHVSAKVEQMPDPATVADGQLEEYLDHFDARQVLHVSFGSVLSGPAQEQYGFRECLYRCLERNESVYELALKNHFKRHLAPFERQSHRESAAED